jgi:hypothetical protein
MCTSVEKFLKNLQLKTVLKYDSNCQEIVLSINNVTLYFYEKQSQCWLNDNLCGTLLLYQTNDCRKYSMILLNNNLIVDMSTYSIHQFSEMELSLTDKYIKVDRGGQYVICLLFATDDKASQWYSELLKCSNICKSLQNENRKENNMEINNKISVKDTIKQTRCESLMTTLSIATTKTNNNRPKQSYNKNYVQPSNKRQTSNQFSRNAKRFNNCETNDNWWRKPK